MIPYPENKPSKYGKYKVQLLDGTIDTAKWNGCGWAIHYFNTLVVKFHPHPVDSNVQLWKWDKQIKSLIKIN
jgi:hypothetical protein